ncbi:PTS sugar transporter subunit IIB [Thomasclavelia ramosa]|uniref:PTS sugar transporter subunit IIB n=1 Tax=Thomasclavelia ramosa TaxID=1547 RepID=UPI00191FD088|nr:hypothetical protein [Thomasclavelia ramosa]MCR1958962.1 hypothetical protein [Thomasclavelia ramosa]QQV04536.1 hypothetical protein I6I62_08840 [Thomasclavelia ramosa]
MNTEDYLLIKSMLSEIKSDMISISKKIDQDENESCIVLLDNIKEKINLIESNKKELDLSNQESYEISQQLDMYLLQINFVELISILSNKITHMEDEILLLRYGLDNLSVRLLIVCGEGISSGFIVNRMKKYVEKGDVVSALPITMLRENIENYDVILVAPHLHHKKMIVERMCELHNRSFGIIDGKTYGKMDGVKILKQAKDLFLNKKKL